MIDKLNRMELMKLISAYYQNEIVPTETKTKIGKGLLADSNVPLHNELLKLNPVSETGKRIKEKMLKGGNLYGNDDDDNIG